MGRIEWDVKDCMQSRQDYIIALQGEKRYEMQGRQPMGCGEARRVVQSYVARRSGWATSWERVRNFEEL